MIYRPSEIKAIRIRLKLTQAELAKRAGVTQAYIAKIEAGEADPRISTMERISRALEESMPKSQRVSIREIMSSPVIYVRPSEKVAQAVQLMRSHDVSQLPVLEGGVQVGSVTEGTLVKKIASVGDLNSLMEETVERIMDGPLPTVGDDADLDTAHRLLEHEPAVLVISHGRAAGIVTKADLFKLTGAQKR
ncbi:MAG: CBS domain-containing protein [Candidatus Hadarchaeales archaeon]